MTELPKRRGELPPGPGLTLGEMIDIQDEQDEPTCEGYEPFDPDANIWEQILDEDVGRPLDFRSLLEFCRVALAPLAALSESIGPGIYSGHGHTPDDAVLYSHAHGTKPLVKWRLGDLRRAATLHDMVVERLEEPENPDFVRTRSRLNRLGRLLELGAPQVLIFREEQLVIRGLQSMLKAVLFPAGEPDTGE